MLQCYQWWNTENEGKLIVHYIIYQIVSWWLKYMTYIIIMHWMTRGSTTHDKTMTS